MNFVSTLNASTRSIFLSFCFVICVLFAAAATTQAATYTVTNTNDSGAGSLRQAILDANATAGADIIEFDTNGVFASPQTITLTSGELVVWDHLAIYGPGADKLTISGNNASRVLSTSGGKTITIDALTVAFGRSGYGGGIYNYNGGTLTLTNSRITDNSVTDFGGGILNGGTLTLTNTTVSTNSANGSGGGIHNLTGQTLTITDSTISGNSAGDGGGIANKGQLTLSNSTIAGNLARWGGGVWNDGEVSLTASNILNNRTRDGDVGQDICVWSSDDPPPPPMNPSVGHGGGIYNRSSLIVDSSLFEGNSTGNGGWVWCGDESEGHSGSPGHGGAIGNESGIVVVRISTFNGNKTGKPYESYFATGAGGGNGAAIYSDNSLSISNSTINSNAVGHGQDASSTAGSGSVFNASNTADSLVLISSIVANTNVGVDVHGLVSGGDNNLVGSSSGVLPGANNITGADPLLGLLQDNGGPTKTHALLLGSPAIDAGSNPYALSFDQRGTGFNREVGPADIGAFEVQPACSGVAFAPASMPGVGDYPESVTTGDFNGDGKLDLTTANRLSGNVSVLLNNGVGGFGAAANFGAGTGPSSVTTGDFNGDGRLDLATANYSSSNVSVLLGDGAGGFAGAANFGVGSGPYSVTTGDFNGDGRLDLATANGNSDNVSVLLNNGAGGFDLAVNFGVGDSPLSVTTGDFNGDGRLDLATANYLSNNVSVLLGDGAGGFAAAVDFGVGNSPWSVTTGDFNGDSKLDLAAANRGSDNVSVLLGNGGGSFDAAVNFGIGNTPLSVTTGDFNGDGQLDLAAANIFSNDVSVLLGNGAGGFAAAVNFGAGEGPSSVTTGDLNGDGKPDLAAANTFSDNVSVLLNTCSTAPKPASITIIKDLQPTGPFEFTFTANGQVNQTFGLTDNGVVGPDRITFSDLTLFGADNRVTVTESAMLGASLIGMNCQSFSNGGPGVNNNSVNIPSRSATIQLEEGEDVVCTFVNARVGSETILDQPATTQYSDLVTLRSTTNSVMAAGSTPIEVGGSVEFRVDGVLVGTDATDASGVAEVTWKVDRLAGSYTVEATFIGLGAYSTSTDTKTLTVTRENAAVTPSANNPVSVKVNSPGGTAGPVTLCADITDSADGSLGDISLAVPVTFALTPVASGPAFTLQNSALSSGGACVTFSSLPVNVYDVTITVGGNYYTGSGSSVIAIFDPSLGFTTGGGRVLNPSTGNVLHFGFSFKYDKKGFKGQMLVMEHTPTGDVKLKSNSLSSLSIVGNQAIVLGKANIADLSGNLNFRLNVTDNGEPGSSDLFGLKTTTAAGAAITPFSIDPPRTILRGNIQVPQGSKK